MNLAPIITHPSPPSKGREQAPSAECSFPFETMGAFPQEQKQIWSAEHTIPTITCYNIPFFIPTPFNILLPGQ